jgi:hypothetical protein
MSKVDAETETKIAAVKESFNKSKDEVIDLLVDAVLRVGS